MIKNICVVVNNRANYARVKSILKEFKSSSNFNLQLVMGASSLLEKYGDLEKIIKKDKFKITDKFYSIVEGGNNLTMAKSTALTLLEIVDVFEKIKPDLVFVVADRFENLSVAVAASYMNIPLAHLQGGEVTGSIDEKVRHAITKLSDIHFVSTKRSKDFVIKMGENKNSVHNTGCPSLDIINFKKLIKIKSSELSFIKKKLIYKKYIVVVQHPVTNEIKETKNHINSTLKAVVNICNQMEVSAAWLWPNVDAGTDIISKKLRIFQNHNKDNKKIVFIKNLSPEDYLSLIQNSKCIVGNSSSGIREASYLGIPSVNIGSRQIYRETAKNVINTEHNSDKIYKAIKSQINKGKYKKSNLYGSGKAAKKILRILKKIKTINVKKKINYIKY
tara:strand:- start:1429 stop:2595 length:1167 start_codon:yes stop_codon:yes gene_type:complete